MSLVLLPANAGSLPSPRFTDVGDSSVIQTIGEIEIAPAGPSLIVLLMTVKGDTLCAAFYTGRAEFQKCDESFANIFKSEVGISGRRSRREGNDAAVSLPAAVRAGP